MRAPVVVVGAGPTGMTVASLLGQAGVPTLVLDRWSTVFPQPRAVHLDDEVYRVLGRLGVAEEFAELSRPLAGLRLLDPEHRSLAEFTRSTGPGPHGYPAANLFDQPALEALLRRNADRFPTVTFRGDVDVVAVTQDTDPAQDAVVELVDRRTGERESVRAAYVLGCDGANSLVRSSIGAGMVDLGFEQRWLVIDVDTDVDLGAWPGVHQVCDPERAATYMQVTDRRHRWEFRLRPEEQVADLVEPDVLRGLLEPWTRDTPLSALTLVRTADYTFRAQVADRWRDRRVFLLGDAAHLTPPFIGQGLGAGLRDAQNLAWKLAGVLAGELPESALDSYAAERKPHTTNLIRTAIGVGHAMTQGGEMGNALRKVLAPRLRLVPGLRQRVVDSRTPRLRASTLNQRRLLRSPLVGALCPNALLEDGRRFDDLGGFVLVTTGPRSPAPHVQVLEVSGTSALGRWLRRGLCSYALVRPDGTVMSAGHQRTDRFARSTSPP